MPSPTIPKRRRPRRKKPAWKGMLGDTLLWTLAILVLLPLLLTMAYRYVPPPITPLMLIRAAEGYPIHKNWRPLSQISPNLRYAVIASEDNLFCVHNGFDWDAMQNAWDTWQGGGRLRGGSTISMQTAKNLFLVPNRTFWRKSLEFPLTFMLEHLWPKQRILEVYLNEAEWGPGIYGAEAAARFHFNTTAAKLTPHQAALLAAILPNPRQWRTSNPPRHVARRAASIPTRIRQLYPGYLTCTVPLR